MKRPVFSKQSRKSLQEKARLLDAKQEEFEDVVKDNKDLVRDNNEIRKNMERLSKEFRELKQKTDDFKAMITEYLNSESMSI